MEYEQFLSYASNLLHNCAGNVTFCIGVSNAIGMQ